MSFKGKIFGALIGFMFGRLAGAILGAFVGHMLFDRRRRTVNPFFHTTFAVMGHIAKSTGQVTKDDIALASALMDRMSLRGRVREAAQQAYRDGKAADYPLKQKLRVLRTGLRFRRDLARFFLEIQIQAALADGKLESQEQEILALVAKELGFSSADLQRLISMWQGERHGHGQGLGVDDAYQVLGVSEQDDLPTIKRAYRKLMAQHHPDKLASQGLPPEMAAAAQQKSQDIQAAWEVLRSAKT